MSNLTKTKRSRLLLMLVLGALLVGGVGLATVVRADSDPGPRAMMGRHCDMHSGGMRDRVGHALHGLVRSQKELGLTAEQETKIKAIALEHEKSHIQNEADIKLAELDVRTDIFNEKVELPTIETALQKSETVRTAMRLEGVKALRAATAVLTPAQREKWHQSMMAGDKPGAWRKGYGHGPMTNPHERPEREG